MTPQTLIKKVFKVNKADLNVTLNESIKTIYLDVTFNKDHKHRCPVCGKQCPIYDTCKETRCWRAMDINTYKVYIRARLVRVECKEHKIKTELVSWARHGSRFTSDFENQIAYLSLTQTLKDASKTLRIAWNTCGPVIKRVLNDIEPNFEDRYNNLEIIGVDETSYKKGHKYITVIVDLVRKQVIHIYEGKGENGFEKFLANLTPNQRNSIKLVAGDGAKWIANVTKKELPNANFCLDPFHIKEWIIQAIDVSRKEVWRELKHFKDSKPERYSHHKTPETIEKLNMYNESKQFSKYTLGKNRENLTMKELEYIDKIKELYPNIYQCYLAKETFSEILRMNDVEAAKIALQEWIGSVFLMDNDAMKYAAMKISSRFNQVINTIKYRVSNSKVESFNNKIKVLVKKAYGFRNLENLKSFIYIVCSPICFKIKPAYSMEFTHRN